MEIDFSQGLINEYGNPLKEMVPHPEGPEHEARIETITLEIISMQALINGERDASLKEKVRRWDLLQTIREGIREGNGQPIEIDFDDVALLRKLINKTYPGPMIVGQAATMLDVEKTKKAATKSEPVGTPVEEVSSTDSAKKIEKPA